MDFVRGYLSEIVVAAPFILKMSLIALCECSTPYL